MALITASVLVACTHAPASPPAEAVTIDRLIAVADGDHLASTYVDGVLADPSSGFSDLLLTVAIRDGRTETAQVEVPNSVTAAPEVLVVSPDGSTAFVAERLGQRRPGDTRADQLPPGTRLSAVDVSDAGSPTVRSIKTVSPSPEAIAISPDGRRIAVVANTPDAAVLDLVEWNGRDFGTAQHVDLASLGVTGDAPGPRRGVTVTNVHWHPSGRAIAVNVDSQNRVAFFAVGENPDGTLALTPWGSPVPTGVDPFVGRFTPDGRHYVTADWGRDLTTTVVTERLPTEPSNLSVIRLGSLGDSSGGHQIVDTAASDTSSEGLAISPDGTLIATVNMRGTAFPQDSPRSDRDASVSLLRLDPATGELTKVGDYPLTAVLPEGGTFDASGRYFIATSFQGRGNDEGGPGLQIFRVDQRTGLVPVQRISLPHGVHHVVAG
jgi:hypothetical protein